MPIVLLLFIVDICLVVHAAKTGRFSPWGYLIIMLPGIGGVAYIVIELLPNWLGSYQGQKAQRLVVSKIDPGRRYRKLSDDLAILDTIANRLALAEECLRIGRFDEAIIHYDTIMAMQFGDEPAYYLGKANAQFGRGEAIATIETLEELKRRWPDYQSADGHLLYARALEAAGRTDEALVNYASVGGYYPGAEPRMRQADLCLSLGRRDEAIALADDVARSLRRAPAHVRSGQRHWLAQAERMLKG